MPNITRVYKTVGTYIVIMEAMLLSLDFFSTSQTVKNLKNVFGFLIWYLFKLRPWFCSYIILRTMYYRIRCHCFLKGYNIGASGDDTGISHKSRKVHIYLYLWGPQLVVGHNLKINLNRAGDFIILRIYHLQFWIYSGH